MFYFRNGGHEEVYLSSADWMRRNLSKRLELLFPVIDPNRRRRLIEALKVYFADNVKAWRLSSDGTYGGLPAGVRACVPSRRFTGRPCARSARRPTPRRSFAP